MHVVTSNGGSSTRGAIACRRETTGRAMGAEDLLGPIALDAAQPGRRRDAFLERKWRAAAQTPGINIALVARQGD